MPAEVKKLLRRAIPIPKEELEATEIVSGQSLTDTVDVLLGAASANAKVTNLSDGSPPKLQPRKAHMFSPLSSIASSLGLDIYVEFYDVSGIPLYFVHEPPVTEMTRRLYAYLKLRIGETGIGSGGILEFASSALEDLGVDPRMAMMDEDVKAAIYYVWRDFLGYGPLEIAMEDPHVEEVSWFAYDGPVQVVDRKVADVYPNAEFVPTNIFIPRFKSDAEKKFIMAQTVRAVAGKAGVGLTVAKPIAEARIPDPSGRGFHRLAAHLDITSRSPGLTIRKFPQLKLSLVSLVSFGNLSPLEAAYLLYQLMRRGFILIVGGMASGKTTLLQALISALPTSYKVITIEDTPELSTPAQNWHPLYVRRAPKASELENVDFSSLVVHSLRHRGTIVTLGEVRGEEMAHLIQAAASGHGAICTFHASDPESVLMRITSPPINAAPESLELITSIVHIAYTKTYKTGFPTPVRRVLRIFEIKEVHGRDVKHTEVFRWDPIADRHNPDLTFESIDADARVLRQVWESSRTLKTIGAMIYSDDAPRVLSDIYALAYFIRDLARRNVTDLKTVLMELTSFYLRLDAVSNKLWNAYFKERLGELAKVAEAR